MVGDEAGTVTRPAHIYAVFTPSQCILNVLAIYRTPLPELTDGMTNRKVIFTLSTYSAYVWESPCSGDQETYGRRRFGDDRLAADLRATTDRRTTNVPLTRCSLDASPLAAENKHTQITERQMVGR